MYDFKNAILYIVLVLVISYTFAGLCYWANFSITFVSIVYMFFPMIVVIFIQKLLHIKNRRLNILFKFNRWFLIALLSPYIIVSIGIFFAVFFLPNVNLAIEKDRVFVYLIQTIPFAIIAGLTINTFFAFGEEFGWRAYMLNALKEASFLNGTIIIGIFWGVWHAPIILQGHNYPLYPLAGVFIFIPFSVMMSIIINYITIKSKSVIAAAIMHGSFNSVGGASYILLTGGDDLLVHITGLSGFIALSVFILVLYFYDTYISREKIMQQKIGVYL